MTDEIPADLLEIAEALVPGTRLDEARLASGQFHHAVLLPGIAAVRISRRPVSAEALPRRTEVLRQIAVSGVPFAVPEPLSPVTTFGERAAVAVSWVDGALQPKGQGDPAEIGALLRALREVPLTPELLAVLGRPHEFVGGDRWAEVIHEEVVPRLPEKTCGTRSTRRRTGAQECGSGRSGSSRSARLSSTGSRRRFWSGSSRTR